MASQQNEPPTSPSTAPIGEVAQPPHTGVNDGGDGSDLLDETGSSSAPSTRMEPDSSIDDEGYAESTSTSFVTSLASDVRRGIEENGRVYAAYGIHKPWVPVDELEVRRYCLKLPPELRWQ